jgi:hypothetical protein
MSANRNYSTSDDSDYIPVAFPRVSDQTRVFGFPLWRWDARTGKRLSNIRWQVSRAIHVLWFRLLWTPLVHEIARECCSLPRRIGTIYATKAHLREPSFGWLGGPHYETQYKQIFACSRDMQGIASRAHWATSLDVQQWILAWGMGAQFGMNNAHTQNLEEVLKALILDASGAPMREVRSASKCDPSRPPPSRE